MSTTEDELRDKVTLMVANKIYTGISIEQIKKLRKSELDKFESLINDFMSLLNTELDKAHVMYHADIAQAIGYCQGLGHPDGYLERRYPDIASLKENI